MGSSSVKWFAVILYHARAKGLGGENRVSGLFCAENKYFEMGTGCWPLADSGQMAQDSGCRSDELVEDAVIGLFDELTYTRETPGQRYDDLESGGCSRLTARKPTGG